MSYVGYRICSNVYENFSRFDGKNWSKILLSTHRHNYVIYMGNYKGQPFVTSSESPNNRKTEIYDHESNKWIGSTDYAWGSLYVDTLTTSIKLILDFLSILRCRP